MNRITVLEPDMVKIDHGPRGRGPLGLKAKFKVQLVAGSEKPRQAVSMCDIGSTCQVVVPQNSCENFVSGVLERVFYVKLNDQWVPPPEPVVDIATRLRPFAKLLKREVGNTYSPVTPEAFAEGYRGKKLVVYTTAAQDYGLQKLNIARDSIGKAFVKYEKMAIGTKFGGRMGGGDLPSAPRIVFPRTPLYNLALGRYLKHVEHCVYEGIAEVYGEATVTKGLNALQTGMLIKKKWSKFSKPVAIGLDAERFDEHVHWKMLEWEHAIYRYMFNRCSRAERVELAKLLRRQLQNRCKVRGATWRASYVTLGTRASGDMNTALGNCTIMCALIWIYMKELGITKFELLNNGDDCVLIIEKDELYKLSGLKAWFLDFGFTMKMEQPVYEMEHIEFCQCRPVQLDPDTTIVVRDVWKSMAKDVVSLNPIRNKQEWDNQRDAVGQCGLALTSGVPIMQSFYLSLMRGSNPRQMKDDGTMSGMKYLARGMESKTKPITMFARESFMRAFGPSIPVQMHMERELDQIKLEYQWGSPLDNPYSVLSTFDVVGATYGY